MGAAAATNKSTLFSTSEQGKELLKKHVWSYSNTTMKVTTSFRDLGSHLNMTAHIGSTTLDRRFSETIESAIRLNRFPISHEYKANCIRTRLLPKALYAVEASKPREALQSKLTTIIKDSISNEVQHKDLNITMITSSNGPDLDTETASFTKRYDSLRCATVKR